MIKPMRLMMTIYPMMLMSTSDRTNDVGDKEGEPADDEDAHHGSQSLCSFCLFWNPFHDYHHGDDDGDKKRGKVPYKKLEFPAKIRNNPNFDKKRKLSIKNILTISTVFPPWYLTGQPSSLARIQCCWTPTPGWWSDDDGDGQIMMMTPTPG